MLTLMENHITSQSANVFDTYLQESRPDTAVLKLLETSLRKYIIELNNKHYLQIKDTDIRKIYCATI